ncbi:hypothetical protein GP475_08970 [Corynebacterium poyangense]|uniref:Uncharacterized protein n=1 Tax=Corynebacterium poyangense TaxID=2684405 RepID=A0A7H0SQD3_9CORY|nr:hypothetical protein [Corynebacterium poyangense]MBZ8178359.1 hypothetical protein [Corynebacterium poyangense]QNQ90758.1 hypothetical protein GP475_08970 [Corynebacterium poyangense]
MAPDLLKLQRQVDKLDTQLTRLIQILDPERTPYSYYREAALFCSLTFEEEILTRNLLASIDQINNEGMGDLLEGIIPMPEETKKLFAEYSKKGSITEEEEKALTETIVTNGGIIQKKLRAAVNKTHEVIRQRNEKNPKSYSP